jgi:hypothetical protein
MVSSTIYLLLLLLLFDSYGLVFWGVLSNERMGMSFVYAAGPRQSSLSRVRDPWDSWPYFTVSDLRHPFRRLLQIAGSRWRYSTPTVTWRSNVTELSGWRPIYTTPLHGLYRKHILQQFICCYIHISYIRILFTEPFPRSAVCSCLLRLCCLAANVVLLSSSRSLPSNGSTRCNVFFDPYSLYKSQLLLVLNSCTFKHECLGPPLTVNYSNKKRLIWKRTERERGDATRFVSLLQVALRARHIRNISIKKAVEMVAWVCII